LSVAAYGLGTFDEAAGPAPRLWDHLRMNPDDDPESRIRELERPLNDQAQASELGGGQPADAAYLPPPTTPYTAPDYNTPAYGTQPPYGAQPYANQPYANQPYGTQPYGHLPYNVPYGEPPRKSSAGIPWVVFGVIAVLFVGGIIAGAVVYTMTNSDGSSVSGGGGSIDIPTIPSIEIPRFPSIPAAPGAPDTDSNVLTGAPGQNLTVSGIDENKTITCNDANVTVSGIRNTVNITGHCGKIDVSGMNNVVTVDAADTIGASGFDNRVTFHAGSPEINATGSNVVELG
jgi:Protein of unknown function (DUF3060)